MEVLEHIGWILLYIFVTTFIPALVVLLANFLTGLGYFIRDLKYDIDKALKERREAKESGDGLKSERVSDN